MKMGYDTIEKTKYYFGGSYCMEEFTTKDITEYLKNAMELEASVYSQKEAITQGQKELKAKEPKLSKFSKPYRHVAEIKKPTYTSSYPNFKPTSMVPCFFFYFFIGCIIFMLIALVLKLEGTPFYVVVGVGASLAAGGVCALIKEYDGEQLKKIQEEKEKYEVELKAYEQKKIAAEQNYEKELEEYNKKVELDKLACSEKQERYKIAAQVLTALDKPLEETTKTLEKLYSVNMIFPKYRNLVAISTIYEYFITGRCNELTGANGAYNLYESELRQNLIIGKLDVIVQQLEEIKQNQYTLYTELQKTNLILSGVASDINNIMNSVERIEDNVQSIAASSYITAYCSQVTAKNTEALKYITLING